MQSDVTRNKVFYIPRSKHIPIPFDKKYSFYCPDPKAFLGHPCEPHIIVNTAATNSPAQVSSLETGLEINGPFSFAAHPGFCSFASSIPDISHFSQVFNYQRYHQELSTSKTSKFKNKTIFPDQHIFNSKIPSQSSSNYLSHKFYSSSHNSSARYVPRSFSRKLTNSDSFKISNEKSASNVNKFNLSNNAKYTNVRNSNGAKYNSEKTAFSSAAPKNIGDSFNNENKIKNSKVKGFKKWDQGSEKTVKTFDDEKKMLFPALPSTNKNSLISETSYISQHSSMISDVNLTAKSKPCALSIETSTSQASYADVIRMSNNTQNPPCKTSTEQEFETGHSNQFKHKENVHFNSDWNIPKIPLSESSYVNCSASSLSHINFSERKSSSSTDKSSFYNLHFECKTSELNNCISPIKTNVETEDLPFDCVCSIDKNSLDSNFSSSVHSSSVSSELVASISDIQIGSFNTDSVYSSPTSISSFSDVFKPIQSSEDIEKFHNQPPVVIENSYNVYEDLSEISFGIEYDEMIQLCSDIDNRVLRITSHQINNNNMFTMREDSLSAQSSELLNSNNNTVIINGKCFCWNEPEINYSPKSHADLADYFAQMWSDCEQEGQKDLKILN